jgi:hypothetical protein
MWWRRADGTLARNLDVTRRAMPYLMRTRNEATVTFEYDVDLQKTDAFIRAWNQANPMLRVDMFHIAVWATRDALLRFPTVHRFVAGGRIYDRNGLWFSYAVKRKLETGAPLAVVKRRFDLDESFGDMVEGMATTTEAATSSEKSAVERELGLLLKFPGFVRRIIMWIIRVADRFGVLPRSYIEKDPMFTSAFFANMASFGMPAVYHHLYEYGTATIFCSIGRPVTAPGSPTSGPDRRRTAPLKWTYDERAEDGLAGWFCLRRIKQIIEDPEACGLGVEARPSGSVDTSNGEGAVHATEMDHTAAPVES